MARLSSGTKPTRQSPPRRVVSGSSLRARMFRLALAMSGPTRSASAVRLWYTVMSPEKTRWHVWYDDYDSGTAFITEGTFADYDDEPNIIASGLPYAEALRRVLEHNAPLDAALPLAPREDVKKWPK